MSRKTGVEDVHDNEVMEASLTFGTSLPVQSVQEIVRCDPGNVPERYLSNIESTTTNDILAHLSSEIPVIDLSLLSNGDKNELQKLDESCREWGFFQIVNHGIAADVLRGVKAVTAKFFELPLEEKRKNAKPPDDIRGYRQSFVVSEEQKLDWSDTLNLFIYPEKFRKLSPWPTIPPDFCKATENYSKEVSRVAQKILIGLFLLMGTGKDDLQKVHGEILQSMRVNYYPICCKPDLVVGLSPHSDASSITVLLQDDDITALQIRHSGSWVPVKPIPNALVINVGDVIEVLSNGRYKSIEHRAMTNKSRERISIATFITPQLHVEIGPLKSCHQDEAKYMKTNYGDFLRSYLTKKLDGKSHIQSIKLDE